MPEVLSLYLKNLKPEIIAARTAEKNLQMSENILALHVLAPGRDRFAAADR